MVRLANINDINRILEIKDQAVLALKNDGVNQWQNGYPNYEVFINDIKNETLFVYDDSSVQGFCNLALEDDPSYEKIYEGEWLTKDSKYLVVHRIAVSTEALARGIASSMFNFAYEFAKKNKARSIRIDTHRNNSRMRKLVERLGYQECGIIYLLNSLDSDKTRIAYELLID